MTDNDDKRLAWIDLMRLVAIFMVIAVHCADPFNISPEARTNPGYGFWGAFWGSMMRPCVPLFVMITGALLLPVKEGMGRFYARRLSRIAVPFLVWSVLYSLFPWVTGLLGLPASSISRVFAYAPADASQSLGDALLDIARIPVNFNTYTVPMWYIYMLIGLYLAMPVFSAWVEKSNRRERRAFLAVWAASLLLPLARRYLAADLLGACAWNGFDTLYYFSGFIGYLLLGSHLLHGARDWSTARLLAPCALLFAAGHLVAFLGFRSMPPDCSEQELELFFLYCSPQVLAMTLAVFMLVRSIRIANPTVKRLLANLGRCGLGIYLVHYFMVGLGYAIADALALPVSIRIPVSALIVLGLTWALVALAHRLFPKAAKWVLG